MNDLRFENKILNIIPKAEASKEKKQINWNSLKLKTFMLKEHYQESKKQAIE